jgi:hypothetical protein
MTQTPHTPDLLGEEEQNELLAEMGEVVYMGALQKAWESLETGLQTELTELLELCAKEPENEDRSTALDAFLEKHVPEWERFLENEMAILQEGLLTDQA